MKNLFIPYELAVIAKEKGFNENCLGWYNYKSLEIFGEDSVLDIYAGDDNRPLAPLYQQIVDWLRDKHNTWIDIAPLEVSAGETTGYRYCYSAINLNTDMDAIDDSPLGYLTYYEALAKAIKEAFKLI